MSKHGEGGQAEPAEEEEIGENKERGAGTDRQPSGRLLVR
jgi:hypothetical protein